MYSESISELSRWHSIFATTLLGVICVLRGVCVAAFSAMSEYVIADFAITLQLLYPSDFIMEEVLDECSKLTLNGEKINRRFDDILGYWHAYIFAKVFPKLS